MNSPHHDHNIKKLLTASNYSGLNSEPIAALPTTIPGQSSLSLAPQALERVHYLRGIDAEFWQLAAQVNCIDSLLIAHGHVRLNNVQRMVLDHTLAGESYADIAEQSTYTVDYLREVGSKLWQLLSVLLGEPVNKKNIRAVVHCYQQTLSAKGVNQHLAWDEVIDVSIFYGRMPEQQTLEKWILEDQCRLIEILAVGGMGKTLLAAKFAQKNAAKFDFVLWRSLRRAPRLPDLLSELTSVLSRHQETDLLVPTTISIAKFVHLLQQYRCLIIFDNLESILLSGTSREYLGGYEDYGEFFRQIAECTHQSCVLLTSREQIAEVANLAGDHLPVRFLSLQGLSSTEGALVLADKGLSLPPQKSQPLIHLYAGNPMALKIIASSILELFDGQVEAFWAQGITVFNGIRILLDSQFDRLSSTEAQIMTWLAIQREGVAVEDLQAAILPAMPREQLLEALEYLHGRSLVIKKAGLFTQEQVVMAYTIKKLLADLQREICDRQPYLLLRYALMQPRASSSVRKSQVSTIVRPLLAMLQTDFGGQEPMILAIKQIFCQLSQDSFAATSYGAGNCLSLLQHLATDVTDLDLSGLTIR